MNKSRTIIRWLCSLCIAVCIPLKTANAGFQETWMSGTGSDSNQCTRMAPCATFKQALSQTAAGGQINVVDAGDFLPVIIDKSIRIANDTSGTAAISFLPFCINTCTGTAFIVIAAGPSDVVTLRGLTINSTENFSGNYGVYVENASQVNIEKCVIRNNSSSGIGLAPNAGGGTLASSIGLKIEDTIVTGAGSGANITSLPSLPMNATISRSSFQNNVGGGIKIDGTSGGPIKVAITDSSISLNGSNGMNAVSGPSGNVRVNLIRDVIASNALAGVQSNQSNGGSASVTVNQSVLSSNGSAWNIVGGATLLSYQNNEVTGTTGTPPSPASFQ